MNNYAIIFIRVAIIGCSVLSLISLSVDENQRIERRIELAELSKARIEQLHREGMSIGHSTKELYFQAPVSFWSCLIVPTFFGALFSLLLRMIYLRRGRYKHLTKTDFLGLVLFAVLVLSIAFLSPTD